MLKSITKNKILKILLFIFCIMFIIFPLSYGIQNLRLLLIGIAILLLIFFLFKKFKINIPEKYYVLIILVLGILTRIGIVFLLKNDITQVSDFSAALNNTFTPNFQSDYYRVFTHWIIYPTIVNFLYKIFGEFQIIAYLTNAVILIIVSLMIYKIGTLLFKNKKYGFYASLIYILWPANILYTMIFTQEHLCALLLLVALYLFLKLINVTNRNYLSILFAILIGFLLGFSSFLKNFSIVFIIAFIIFFGLSFLHEKINWKDSTRKLLIIVIIVIFSSITKNIMFNYIDSLVKNDVARNIIPCYLNVGLRDYGTYSDKNYAMYFDNLKNNNYDYDKTNKEIIEDLINYWKNEKSINDFVLLMDYKANIIFGNDSSRISWVKYSLQDYNQSDINLITNINNLYFVCLCILMLIGLMHIIKNLKLFLCYLIFFGGMLLLLFIEAQNRYMYGIQTLMCILSVSGIIELNKIIKGRCLNNGLFKTNKSKTLD